MKKLKSHRSFAGVTEFYKHDSKATGTSMNFSVFNPVGKPRGGVIWLSGLTCNEENFITKAGAQKVLSELGLAVICPDTSPRGLNLPQEHESYDFGSGAGFYVDALTEGYKDHYRMASYINTEIYDIFNSMFDLKRRVGLFGHSMGGHGALVLGLKNPTLYKSLSAFSPIMHPSECPWGQKAFCGYLGDNKSLWQANDATELLKSGRLHPKEILVDQGLADDFYPEQLRTEDFQDACQAGGQPANIRLQEGFDHSYYFIATFLDDHLKHHANLLSSLS